MTYLEIVKIEIEYKVQFGKHVPLPQFPIGKSIKVSIDPPEASLETVLQALKKAEAYVIDKEWKTPSRRD